MNIVKTFEKAFKRKKEENWECIYVFVDIHGTIFFPRYDCPVELYSFYPYAEETLKILSAMNDVKIILWSSTTFSELNDYVKYLQEHDIHVDAVNSNPFECVNENACKGMDFSQKPYFNVGIDDKFGFEAESDWKSIYNYLTEHN